MPLSPEVEKLLAAAAAGSRERSGRPRGQSKYFLAVREAGRPLNIEQVMVMVEAGGVSDVGTGPRDSVYQNLRRLVRSGQLERRGDLYGMPGAFDQ